MLSFIRQSFLVICFFGIHAAFSQKSDSLTKTIANHKTEDSSLVNLYNSLATELYKKTDSFTLAKVWELAVKAELISGKINFKKGQAFALMHQGNYFFKTNNTISAFKKFQESYSIADEIKDDYLLAANANKIGYIHWFISGNGSMAVPYFQIASEIYRKSGDNKNLARTLTNLGSAYHGTKQEEKTLACYEEAFHLFHSLNDSASMSLLTGNIAEHFLLQNKFDKAQKYVTLSRKYSQTPFQNSFNDNRQGEIYLHLKDYKKAEDFFKKAYSSGIYVNNYELAKSAAENLSVLYKRLNDTILSIYYENKSLIARDSLRGDDKQNLISGIETANTLERLEMKKENEARLKELDHKNKTQKQNLIIAVSVLFLIVIGAALFITIKRHRITVRQKQIIESQKKEVEVKNEIIEEKQKEILDSIKYAKRIQDIILASEETLNENLTEHFVLFKPKDIVSGDFYWSTTVNTEKSVQSRDSEVMRNDPPDSELTTHKLFYLAVCDSTGHGVPGAFMSLLNTNFLNEAINEKKILSPDKVLNYVRERLIDSMSKEEQKDGFDGTLVCIDKSSGTVTYAAAYNAPLMISDGVIRELKADKMPVGKGERREHFTLNSLQMKKGDLLYLYTDGYADQFGGPKGKKFKYKKLNDLLIEGSLMPMPEQKEQLQEALTHWMGGLEQVDDICVIGIRF